LLRKRIEVHLLVESQKAALQNYNDHLQEMVETKTKSVLKLQNKILKAVAELVECRDDITGGHIERTERCLGILVSALLERGVYADETSKWNVNLLLQSSQLHDVGKISIQDSILRKPGKLTSEEFEAMKKHTTFGVDIIERIEESDEESAFLDYAKIFAGFHHEKWDGSGYPYGVAGEQIPLLGRLMAFADVYDALTSVRPYKKAFSHDEAMKIIAEGKGCHFDPNLADIFVAVADQLVV
jgi:putative two-component system response regulator